MPWSCLERPTLGRQNSGCIKSWSGWHQTCAKWHHLPRFVQKKSLKKPASASVFDDTEVSTLSINYNKLGHCLIILRPQALALCSLCASFRVTWWVTIFVTNFEMIIKTISKERHSPLIQCNQWVYNFVLYRKRKQQNQQYFKGVYESEEACRQLKSKQSKKRVRKQEMKRPNPVRPQPNIETSNEKMLLKTTIASNA